MARVNKGLRLRQDVLDRAAHLRFFHPEHETEAAMLHAILYRGLVLMEAEVLVGGGGPPPGYTKEQIIIMVLPKLLPLLQLVSPSGLPFPVQQEAVRAQPTEAIDGQTSEDLGRLGSEFL
jgi:hypothetical protein